MSIKVVFIAGIHGVGKGYFTTGLCNISGWPCYSASALIKDEKNKPIDIDKVTIDANINQDHLISALSKLAVNSDAILLDGHFILKVSTGYFEVPIETFRSMKPKAVILLTERPEIIERRLLERDGHSLPLAEIINMQSLEILRAKSVCESLNNPFLETSSAESRKAFEWLSNLI